MRPHAESRSRRLSIKDAVVDLCVVRQSVKRPAKHQGYKYMQRCNPYVCFVQSTGSIRVDWGRWLTIDLFTSLED